MNPLEMANNQYAAMNKQAGMLSSISGWAKGINDVTGAGKSTTGLIGDTADLIGRGVNYVKRLTPGRAAAQQALRNPIVGNLHNLANDLSSVGLDVREASQLSSIHQSMNRPNLGQTILHSVMAVPLAAGALGLGSLAASKLDELRRISGIQDPISEYAIRKGLSNAAKNDPELLHMSADLLHERASALYKVSPSLFEPENREVLKNLLLRVKDMGGPDPSVLTEVGNYEKAVQNHGQKYTNYLDIGNTMLGN